METVAVVICTSKTEQLMCCCYFHVSVEQKRKYRKRIVEREKQSMVTENVLSQITKSTIDILMNNVFYFFKIEYIRE